MDKTANYGLNKPAGSDYADVNVLNENMDVIDLEMKNQEDSAKEHAESKKNPHGVTKEQVGLGNVPNVATNDQTPTYTEAGAISQLVSGEKLSAAFSKLAKAITDLISHIANKSNPHVVTAAQVGADAAGAAAAVQQNLNSHAGNSGIHVTSDEKKTWDGKADLDSSGKVPTSQLPEISSVKTYTATIGTTWTEDETTGVKSQNVAISGVLAKHTAKVDHAYTGSGTSEDYATFVEAENQYLDYITNGYAETYDGGIKCCIFGDAPTVSIPIVV